VKDWLPPFPATSAVETFDDAKQLVRESLFDAVCVRLLADVPVGVFLSGGIDSAIVTALAAQASDQKVRTFSVSFPGEAFFDESKYANAVADMINNARDDKPLPVYGDGSNVRDWLYVEDHCSALWAVLTKGDAGRVYNIGGNSEKRNLAVVAAILRYLDKPDSLIQFVTDRPGHDFRYAIDATRIYEELGWQPSVSFETGLAQTIQWYLDNQDWLDQVVSGAYKNYYESMYAGR